MFTPGHVPFLTRRTISQNREKQENTGQDTDAINSLPPSGEDIFTKEAQTSSASLPAPIAIHPASFGAEALQPHTGSEPVAPQHPKHDTPEFTAMENKGYGLFTEQPKASSEKGAGLFSEQPKPAAEAPKSPQATPATEKEGFVESSVMDDGVAQAALFGTLAGMMVMVYKAGTA